MRRCAANVTPAALGRPRRTRIACAGGGAAGSEHALSSPGDAPPPRTRAHSNYEYTGSPRGRPLKYVALPDYEY